MFEWLLSPTGYLTVNLVLCLISIGISIAKNGEPKFDWNWIDIIMSIIFSIWTWKVLVGL